MKKKVVNTKNKVNSDKDKTVNTKSNSENVKKNNTKTKAVSKKKSFCSDVKSLQIFSGVLFFLLIGVVILFLLGQISFESNNNNNEREVLPIETVTENILTLVNEITGGGVVFSSSKDLGELYEIIVTFEGNKIPLYATKDGEYYSPQVIPLNPENDALTQIEQPSAQNEEFELISEIDENQIVNAPYLGDENAQILIIEFSDYSCPFCARHYTETKPLIISDYVDKGLVKYVWKDFVGVGTSKPHEAALCVREIAGDDAFWSINGLILENQQEVRGNINKINDLILEIDENFDIDSYNDCLESGKYTKEVSDSTAFGKSLRITGTPGFLIGNNEIGFSVIRGAYPYDTFKQMIDSKLN